VQLYGILRRGPSSEGRNQWTRQYAQTLNENCPDFYTM